MVIQTIDLMGCIEFKKKKKPKMTQIVAILGSLNGILNCFHHHAHAGY